jgi:hypothetical protein
MATNGTTDTQIISGVNGSGTYLPLSFYTNNALAAQIDTSGNVGIGTANPARKLTIQADDTNALPSSTTAQLRIQGNTNSNYQMYVGLDTTTGYGYIQPTLVGTSYLNLALCQGGGNVLVGTTSAFIALPLNLQGSGSLGQLGLRNSGATAGKYWSFGPNASNNIICYNNSSVGVYIVDGGTSWTGTSDERLKTDLKPIENAAEKVSTLRAVTGRFIADEENKSRAFLIAQDVQKVLPEAVDASDPEKLGIAYTDVIPLLVAAIKEQQTIINELKSRIEALESK